MSTTRAAIYCRISQDREGAGLGVERQRQDCEDLAGQHAWTVTATFTDNDVSAYSGKPRPGYKALLEALRSGSVDAVLVWHTDRLHRSPAELEEYITVCEPRRIPTQTVRAGQLDLATATGRMVARQLGAVARYEVEQMGARIKRQKAQALSEGRFIGGPRPFGWKFADDGKVTLDRPVARRLAKAHRDVLAGISLGTIVKQWNAEGFKTATGKQWSHTVLRDALMRARNGGLVEAHGKIVGKSAWPAIVSEDVWRAVHDKFADGTRTHRNQSNRVKYLLGGIAVCGKPMGVEIVEDQELGPTEVERICGNPLHASPVGGHQRRVYRCDIADRRGHVAVSVPTLDKFVTDTLLDQLRWPKFWERYSEATTTSEHKAAELREQESALETRIEQSLSAFTNDPNVSPTELSTILEGLKAKLTDVRARLADAEAKAHRVLLDPADVERQWDALSIERKRILIRDALTSIVVLPTDRRGPKFDPSRVLFGWTIAATPGPDEYLPRRA